MSTTTGFGISPATGGFLTRPIEPPRDDEWEIVQPGWGQLPGLMTIEWGGETHEFDVRVSDAPIIYERADHPNRPAPWNHGGRSQ